MIVIALLMFGVYLPGLYLLTHGTRAFLKKKKTPAKVNRAATIIIAFVGSFALVGGITWGVLYGSFHGWFAGDEETYEYHGSIFTAPQDELPLIVEDLLNVNYSGYIRAQTSMQSVLLAQYEAHQYARFDAENFREMPDLEYTITLVKIPALYDLCKDALLKGFEIDFSRGWEVTPEQMSLVSEKLGNVNR